MKKVIGAILIACVAAGCGSAIWRNEINTLANARDQLQRYTLFMAPALARLDRDAAQEYINLARGRGFDPASVVMPDGITFVTMQPAGDSSSLDDLLRAIHLIRGVPLSSRILYHGQYIGEIHGVWINRNIYAYFEVALIVLLALAVALLAERRIDRERLQKAHDELEVRVQERTAELRESEQRLRLLVVERDESIRQLQEAMTEVKTLSGLLPICAKCKKVRDDTGYWNRIESYVEKRTDATFTHGLCPDCGIEFFKESNLPVPEELLEAARKAR